MKKLSMEELERMTISQFKESDKIPVTVILDNVRSQHNIGSIFRTADAFRIERIHLCGITATPPNREINKTALGATESVEWKYHTTTRESVEELRSQGYVIIAIEQAEGSIAVKSLNKIISSKNAIIFGNEVHGVDDEIMQLCDYCVEIPQYGTKHSLNIAVSAGIAIWEFCNIFLTD